MSSYLPPIDPLELESAGGTWAEELRSQSHRVSRTQSGSRRNRGTYRPHRGRYQPRNAEYRLSRDELRDFAELTLKKLGEGWYMPPNTEEPYDLGAKITYTNENTAYYAPDEPDIENWAADLGLSADSDSESTVKIVIREYSTLVGARRLHGLVDLQPELENKTIGVLNFASAKQPGGGFINGAQAQEESIARASTLYPSLVSPIGMQFYEHYAEDPDDSYYTHAMTYSPSVVLFRNDKGNWMKPIEVDVLTSAAVNAGEVREQVHKAEKMRLLRERVKAAEELRKKARERKRELEEQSKKKKEREESEVRKRELEEQSKEKEESDGPEGTKENVETTDETTKDTGKEDAASEAQKEDRAESSSDIQKSEEAQPQAPEGPEPPQQTGAQTDTQPDDQTDAHTHTPPEPSAPESSGTPPDPFYLAEIQIDVQMYERIGRLLYLFHKRGVKHLVLGSFGTGVFQNRVELVAGIFYDLLAKPNAKFKNAFDTVVFAILGGPTIKMFRDVFGGSALDKLEGEEEVLEDGSDVEGMKDRDGDHDVQPPGRTVEKPIETQMDGMAEEKPSDDQVEEAQQSTNEAKDVEMSDMTQEPAVEPTPDTVEVAAPTKEEHAAETQDPRPDVA